MTRFLRLSGGLIGLIALIAVATVMVGKDVTARQGFFDPCGSGGPVDTAANSPSNISGKFGIGVGADCIPLTADDNTSAYNSGGLIYFTPPEWEVAEDADIPDGTQVGTFGSRAILGLLDNGCNTVLGVPFNLLDGTINRSNSVDADPPGSPNRLDIVAQDVNPANGIPDGAEKWPSYLDGVAERANMDLSKLIARFVGFNTTSVSGTTVVLNFLIFEPGAKVSNLINLDPRLGYPAVTVLQDPSAAASNEDPVSDFCAPLYTETTLFGEAGGATFRGNPGDGQYNFVTWVASATDEDGDGIENALDPCNLVPNTSGWDPRGAQNPIGSVTPGDSDSDGIPDDCDPFPNTPSLCVAASGISGHDEDCDGWQNRGDNCPLDANEDQEDVDSDGLGDVCDPNNNVRSPQTLVCLITPVTIGAGGAAPEDPNTMQPCNPNAPLPPEEGSPTPVGQTPAPTPVGQTPSPRPVGGGVGTGSDTGIGSLAPTSDNLPIWAAVFVAVGALGALGGFTMVGSRLRRRR